MEKSHSIDKSTHSTHGMRSKKNNEFQKFRERKRKKTLVKKRINVEKSIFIYVQEKLVPFGTKEVKRTAAMFVMKKKT